MIMAFNINTPFRVKYLMRVNEYIYTRGII